MSKRVKNFITQELTSKFKDVDGVAVINPRGIDATKNNLIRRRLSEKGLRMTVVKNTLVKRAVGATKLKGFEKLLDGPSALIYGKTSLATIARLLIEEQKLDEKLEVRGLFFDGDFYTGAKGIKQASELPTREEAIARVLTAIVSPGRRLGGVLKGQAGKVVALVVAAGEKAKAREAAAPAPAAAAPATAAPVAAEAAPTA